MAHPDKSQPFRLARTVTGIPDLADFDEGEEKATENQALIMIEAVGAIQAVRGKHISCPFQTGIPDLADWEEVDGEFGNHTRIMIEAAKAVQVAQKRNKISGLFQMGFRNV